MKIIGVVSGMVLLASGAAAGQSAPLPVPEDQPGRGMAHEGVRRVAYGGEVPTLHCAPLQACRVELQAGESLLSPPALGDSERWLTAQIASGPGGVVPVVVVKPTACGIATNLVIATDRRIYDLDLESAPCRPGRHPIVRAVRFEYPDEPEAVAARVVKVQPPTLAERAAGASHTGYRWRRKGSFPWEPVRVADDGEHVYLELPPVARLFAAPVLYSTDTGEPALMNHATEGEVYVTDRVFHRAVLRIGEDTLEIERTESRARRTLSRRDVAVVSVLGGLAAGLLIGR